MHDLILFILAIICCAFFTKFLLQNKEIKRLKNKLSEINSRNTNEEVRISYPNKNLEELIREINKSIKAKKANESKYKEIDMELRQAIANVSHDLRTPLTSVIGYLQLVDDTGISEQERREYISILKDRAENLKVLIAGFYDLSRLEAEEYEFQREKINLGKILIDLLLGFYEEINRLGLKIDIDIEEDIQRVYGDEIAVKRIFSNLIQNIIKHGEDFVKVTLKYEDDSILMEFANYAPNLSEEDSMRIFERFFTGDRMRTGKNTGLGLAITKELVEKQGQRIWSEIKEDILSIKIKWKIED